MRQSKKKDAYGLVSRRHGQNPCTLFCALCQRELRRQATLRPVDRAPFPRLVPTWFGAAENARGGGGETLQSESIEVRLLKRRMGKKEWERVSRVADGLYIWDPKIEISNQPNRDKHVACDG